MMKSLTYTLFIIVAVASAAATISSCDTNTVYDSYNHTPISGWEKNDTLHFEVGPLRDSGHFTQSVGLRINQKFPFTSLSLVVEQRIFPGFRFRTDTLRCQFYGDDDNLQGRGVSYYQFNFPLRETDLRRGDSIHVTIRHAMKREILPGISDIGFIMKHSNY
jgi:gliding motility-associated lipoprotein GldH